MYGLMWDVFHSCLALFDCGPSCTRYGIGPLKQGIEGERRRGLRGRVKLPGALVAATRPLELLGVFSLSACQATRRKIAK